MHSLYATRVVYVMCQQILLLYQLYKVSSLFTMVCENCTIECMFSIAFAACK